MLLQILGAVGVVFLLTVLTVLLPGLLMSRSWRPAVRGWAEWCGVMLLLFVPAGLIGLAWAWLEN